METSEFNEWYRKRSKELSKKQLAYQAWKIGKESQSNFTEEEVKALLAEQRKLCAEQVQAPYKKSGMTNLASRAKQKCLEAKEPVLSQSSGPGSGSRHGIGNDED